MKLKLYSHKLLLPLVIGSLAFTSCVKKPEAASSDVKVTSVAHTFIKKQSIGNCWSYAVNGWAESLHKSSTGNEIDISESYVSWWASYYDLLESHDAEEVQTGGSWDLAARIFLKHGWVLEGDFIPEESEEAYSVRQEEAMKAIAKELEEGGKLYGSSTRTPENIVAILDAAFGVEMAKVQQKVRSAKDLIVGKDGNNTITLYDALRSDRYRWTEARNPQNYGKEKANIFTRAQRQNMYKRVQKALNDRMPVIMSFMVGFDALDPKDGMFKLEMYEKKKGLGREGGHMVVLSDYTVDNVPGIGSIGEGEVPEKLKEAALRGDVRYFVAKNSWGTNRPERGITDGYTRIAVDYLEAQLPWTYGEEKILSSALMDFVLPPGY